MTPDELMELLRRWKDDNDQSAAQKLYAFYAGKLIEKARRRLSPKMAKRIEPEEIANSAARTFLDRVQKNKLIIPSGDKIWALLVNITIKKLNSKIEFHQAQKRDPASEVNSSESYSIVPNEALAREPDVSEVLALEEIRDRLLTRYSAKHQNIIKLYLQEYTTRDISTLTKLGERMVNRVLERFKQDVKKLFDEPDTQVNNT